MEANFYKVIDHTADTGIEVSGSNMSELFCHAGMAVTDLMVDLENISRETEKTIIVEADGSPESLLVCWLNEILYEFEKNKFLISRIEDFNFLDSSLKVVCRGETFDSVKHYLKTSIKAATYHTLKIIKKENKLTARIILDL